MAAAALFQSVASKMGRAPGGSLQPPTSNEQERGDRFVVAGFPYLSKLACARLAPHHRLHSCASPNSGASDSTQPSHSKMDLRTKLAKATAGVAYFTFFGPLIYIYGSGSVMLAMDKLEDILEACSRKSSNLNNNLIAMEHVSDEGHGKQPDGATEKGTRVYTVEEGFVKVYRGIMELCADMKELQASIKDAQAELQASIKDAQAEMKETEARITELKISLESAPSKGKGKE